MTTSAVQDHTVSSSTSDVPNYFAQNEDDNEEETNRFNDAYLQIEYRVICWVHMLNNVLSTNV